MRHNEGDIFKYWWARFSEGKLYPHFKHVKESISFYVSCFPKLLDKILLTHQKWLYQKYFMNIIGHLTREVHN